MTAASQALPDYALPKDPSNILRRSVSRTLRNAFLATNVQVAVNGEWMPASSATRTLGNPVQVITAWNPFGNQQPIELNRAANQHLRHALESNGWDVHPALGESLAGDWQEESWAVVAQSRRQLRRLARGYGQLAIFSVTSTSVTVIGASTSHWSDTRAAHSETWVPPAESALTLAAAVASAGLAPVTGTAPGSTQPGWVHEDSCGIPCPQCGAHVELFGCEPAWPALGDTHRRTALVCAGENRLLKASEVLPHAHDAIAARREYLMAREDADARKRLRPAFAVYCVELEPKPGVTSSARPPIYVGQTTRTPEERFAQHKAGYRASAHVKDRGLRLRPDLTSAMPPLRTEAEALGLERWLAASMRARGWEVAGGT